MSWSQFFDQYQQPLIDATWVTLKLAFVSFGIALIVGVIIVSFRVSPVPPLVKFATWFVSVFRNIPLLVIFFLALFGLGDLNLVFDYFPTAAVALGLYSGAYVAEVLRSGINAVPQGQAEAGRSIGLGFTQLLRHIIIPQAFRTVIGPIGNLFVANFKNTAVASTISVVELTAQSSRMFNNAAAGVWRVLFTISVIYLVFLLPAGFVFRRLEARYAIHR
ncbi:MAG: amino acid ABC transporter permease [Candidatus Microthrix sp.]|nr:amino acid ABC transporter permease [Candidatus Microthrix sp.]MBP7595925.1 amino acid ABC transporter permease [Candidatus Microthrix sp.]